MNMYEAYAVLLAWGLVIHLVIWLYKKSLKKRMLSKFSREATSETNHEYVEYYQQAQKIDFMRVMWWIVILGIILYVQNAWFLTWLAIWVWAIIVTFSSFIVSLSYYFYLLSEFKVGQTVRIGDHWQGEIISIKPLHMWLSGKNDNGEHTGEFFLVPNKLVWENTITRIDLQKKAVKKVLLALPFDAEKRGISYELFLDSLKTYLHEFLPTNTATTVGYFQSYIGHKYKMDVEYKENGIILVHVWFLATLTTQRKTKQKIIAFVESLKRNQEKALVE